jgi:hypothetical protein
MSEFTVIVPADYREAFRAGVLLEVFWDAEQRTKEIPTLVRDDIRGLPEDQRESSRFESHRWFCDMAATGRLMAAALEADGDGDLEIEGDPEAIYRSLHEMMHKVTGPMVTEAADALPPERKRITRWTKATEWALSEMARAEVAMNAAEEA